MNGNRYTWCRRVFPHHYCRRRRRRHHYLWLIIYHRSHLTAYSSSSLLTSFIIVIVFVVAVIVSPKYPDWESWIKKTDLFAYFWCHLGFRSLVTHTAGKKRWKKKTSLNYHWKWRHFVTVTSTRKQNHQDHNTGSVHALTHYCLANRWVRHDGNLTTRISLPAKNGEK